MLSVVLAALLSADPTCESICGSPQTATAAIAGDARQAESKNFQIICHRGCCDARAMAQVSEQWRDHLRAKWLNESEESSWLPRCVVVVHSRRDTYLAAVGRGGQRSFGSTWIDVRDQKVCSRRLDLLTDSAGRVTALGHELTHAVIADAFAGKQPPPWANEGMALLADSADKQDRHERDANAAIRARSGFHFSELMALDSYPRPERIPAFYGQSATLVRELCRLGPPHQVVSFVKQAEELGCDQALRKTYNIDGTAELQRLCSHPSSLPGGATMHVAVE